MTRAVGQSLRRFFRWGLFATADLAGLALLYHHGGQAPLLPSPTSAASSLSTAALSFLDHPASATSAINPLSVNVASPSLAALAPTDTRGSGLSVVVTPDGGITRSSTRQEQPPTSTLGTELSSSVPTNVPSEVGQMKRVKTKATIGILATLIGYVSLNSFYRSLHPEAFVWCEEDREDAKWIATSRYWLDRKACRWIGICGAAHLQFAKSVFGGPMTHETQQPLDGTTTDWDWQNAWSEGKERPEDWTHDERVLREIPDYVMEYAPLVHLFSGEQFWPGDIAEHLHHTTPTLNYTPLPLPWHNATLDNLDGLNKFQRGKHIFLTSNDNVEDRPEWLGGEKNIPSPPPEGQSWEDVYGLHVDARSYRDQPEDQDRTGEEWDRDQAFAPAERPKGEELAPEKDHAETPIRADLRRRRRAVPIEKNIIGGRSAAPAVLVAVNKGDGIVDAFWFFFYSFNLGNVVFNIRFGNHVGDWEHTAIRFQHGVPKAVFFSEHDFGSAFTYTAVEKMGKRPIIYSATGTHAMYATPGIHAYILPWGLLHDETDRGPLWDPALNLHAYTYDHVNDIVRSSQLTPKSPIAWFHYNGHWGDKFYPLDDTRQYRLVGQYHYVNGPVGPKFKNLGRKYICADESIPCQVKNWLGGSSRIHRGKGPGEMEEMSAADEARFLGNDTSVSNDL